MPRTTQPATSTSPQVPDPRRHGLIAALGASVAALLVVAGATMVLTPAYAAAEAPVELGTATPFAVLAGSTVTNTGASVISGDLGVSPGSAVTGFPPGIVSNGTIHASDAVAAQAQKDLTTAYGDAAGRSTTDDVTGEDLGGKVLVSGVYENTSGMQLTGTLTLDAQGDPGAVFVFKAGSTLVTGSDAVVALINGASPCHVYWQVGSSATLGVDTQFAGTVMALTSATLNTGADVQGRILARNGAVTLESNTITAPDCSAAPTTSTGTTTTTATDTASTATATDTASTGTPTVTPSTGTPTTTAPTGTPTTTAPTSTPTGTGIPTTPAAPGDGGGQPPLSGGGPAGPGSPVIPVGHPHTGRTPIPAPEPWVLVGLGTLVAGGALLAAKRAGRTSRRH
jgi:hypothetical protein